MAFSITAANAVLNHLIRNVPMATPSRVWIALHTADPSPNGGSEVTAAQWPLYARVDPSMGGPVANGFSSPANKVISNSSALFWPVFDGPANLTVTHASYWDAISGGNCLLMGALQSPRTLFAGDELAFRVGALTLEAQ
jgi:hypothetical protein